MASAEEESSLVAPPPPHRKIYNDADLEKFLHSPIYAELLRFTGAMGRSCSSSTFVYSAANPLQGVSPAIACLCGALSVLETWVETDFPPHQSGLIRFGNPAFKEWHQRLTERSVSIVSTIILKYGSKQHHGKSANEESNCSSFEMSLLLEAAEAGRQAAGKSVSLDDITDKKDREIVQELCCYLHDAFGHPIRLDYGTGHESSFQVFLFCLACKLHLFGSTASSPPTPDRLKAVTLSTYHAYLEVTRKLQTDYMLEPAGSHGVWGLDDYHCLPFYFGACELQSNSSNNNNYTPESIHDDRILQEQGDSYLYFGCIRFVKSLKKGVPFFESSPMLNDISNLPTWSKVANGLLKLYEGEVLKKRQVVQHFQFGTLFAANWTPSQRQPPTAPTDTFRTTTTTDSSKEAFSPTRAPWAT